MEKNKKIAPCATTQKASPAKTENNDITNNIPQNAPDVKNELTATIPFHDLEDFVWALQRHIEHAECLVQEIAYEYFGQTKEVTPENSFRHLWSEYNTYSIKADIVAESLFTLRKMAEAASAYIYSEEGEQTA